MAKRRHYGTFCLALLYNFLALVYGPVELGSLIAYSTKVHQYHNWLIDRDGTSISQFDTGMAGGVATVSSMAACDTAAGLDSGTSLHFGAHPTLTRVVHLWAGRRRWRPQRQKLKQIVFRKRRDEGKRICDDRVEKQDFQVIASGTSLIEWRDIRKIRISFQTNAQTLHRL
ncbi:unnamed protein product [Peronospora farinosa]|nr:unnamed protein product [Peronospora farinosa]